MIIENQSMRIATGVLNEILAEAVAMQQPPSDKGRRLKIFNMTQISVKPPTFVVFVNDKKLMLPKNPESSFIFTFFLNLILFILIFCKVNCRPCCTMYHCVRIYFCKNFLYRCFI